MTPPRLHLTICKHGDALTVEIPRANLPQFPAGQKVRIALEDDPAIHINSIVWGEKRRYATIRKHRQHSDRFPLKTDVVVEAV